MFRGGRTGLYWGSLIKAGPPPDHPDMLEIFLEDIEPDLNGRLNMENWFEMDDSVVFFRGDVNDDIVFLSDDDDDDVFRPSISMSRRNSLMSAYKLKIKKCGNRVK